MDAKHFHDKSPCTHSVERIHAGFTFQGQNSCSKREGVLPSKSYVQKNGLEPSLGWYYLPMKESLCILAQLIHSCFDTQHSCGVRMFINVHIFVFGSAHDRKLLDGISLPF